MSRLVTKPTKCHVCPAKTQISLGIRPVWSESSLSAWRKLGSLATHWAHSKDSDQTEGMPRLIWVFAGRSHFIGFVMRRLILVLRVSIMILTCSQYSSAIRLAHSIHRLTGRQGLDTSAHLMSIRFMRTLFSGVASWEMMEALSGEQLPLWIGRSTWNQDKFTDIKNFIVF